MPTAQKTSSTARNTQLRKCTRNVLMRFAQEIASAYLPAALRDASTLIMTALSHTTLMTSILMTCTQHNVLSPMRDFNLNDVYLTEKLIESIAQQVPFPEYLFSR
ncbi:hypothetical protein CEXT_749071 [Caerostris extrusa]|uniref:Uncharacterized protein n=1 Tax=Caerostris extrusa TaxID=172846 RepID=A0AAV4P3E5_CAEEX|nr:hypothetical protein CEXT_749071 [Caerostris extrusa]